MTEACRNIVVMGVCGVGKSTIARRLAESCNGRFIEGDSYHSAESVNAMANGIPLTDAARWGWLERICDAVSAAGIGDATPAFVACSALKRRYRDLLREKIGPLAIVHLDGDPDIIRARLVARANHFMPPRMLESQLRDLEPPDPRLEAPVLRLDVDEDLEDLVGEAAQFCLKQQKTSLRPHVT